jgi:hypothetical protein
MRNIIALQKQNKKRKFEVLIKPVNSFETVTILGSSTVVPAVYYEVYLNGQFVRCVSYDGLKEYCDNLATVLPRSEDICLI